MGLEVQILLGENFNFVFFLYQLGKFSFVLRCAYSMIIDPVVIAAAWFPKYDSMVLKAI